LVLSANTIATTAIRAISMRIPAVSLEQATDASPLAPGRLGLEKLRYLRRTGGGYPFSVWPLGLHRLIAAVLDDNPLGEALVRLDVLDPTNAAAKIGALLSDPSEMDSLREQQTRYLGRLDALDDADAALDAALR